MLCRIRVHPIVNSLKLTPEQSPSNVCCSEEASDTNALRLACIYVFHRVQYEIGAVQ